MFGMKPIPPLDHYIPQTITKVVPPFDYQLDVYIYIYTLQIQNRSFSRVCSNTRGLHTKPEVFENLITFEVWLLFWIPCWIKSACWCVFLLAKLTVFACQTQLAMSWLAQPRLLPHPLSKRLCVFCRCPFTNHVQTVENPVKSQPSKPVQKVRVSTGLVYGFSTGSVRVWQTRGFCKDLGFSQKYYGLVRVYYGFSTGWVRVWTNPNFSPSKTFKLK